MPASPGWPPAPEAERTPTRRHGVVRAVLQSIVSTFTWAVAFPGAAPIARRVDLERPVIRAQRLRPTAVLTAFVARELRHFLRLLGLLAFGVLLFSGSARAESDLRQVDFEGAGRVVLDQGWTLYPGQLLNPQALAAGDDPARSAAISGVQLPLLANRLQADSYGLREASRLTLVQRLQMPAAGGQYALRLGDIGAAYRLWVNGQLLLTQGRVAAEPGAERAQLGVRLVEFRNEGEPVELVLEVSNHLYAERWRVDPVVIGLADAILARQNQQWGGAHFFAGCLLMMGCYHLLFFSFRRQNSGPLFFGLYCLLWVLSFAASTSSDWFALLYFPALPAPLLHRIEALGFFASVPVGFMFFKTLFPHEFSTRILRLTQALAVCFVLAALAIPIPALLMLQHLYYLVSILLIAYVLWRMVQARRRGREGASFILWGFAVLGGFAINDMLSDLGVIDSIYLIHVGLFFFILAQGLALALQFSRAFASVERLSGDLESRNAALEDEIVERARLEREIANVSEKERRFLSHSLHDGLCQHLTAARLRCAALEQKHEGDDDGGGRRELGVLAQLLQQTVDQAYALARGLWPVEHDRQRMAAFLTDYCRQLSERHEVRIEIARIAENLCVDNERIVQLYRIAQEAIANAAKHARAQRIEVSIDDLNAGSMVMMTVVDDGIGISVGPQAPNGGGLGMRMMAYRARMINAELQIGRHHPAGTLVRCTIRCAGCTATCAKKTDRAGS